MTTEELLQVVTTAGYECRVKGIQVVFHVCIFCGNDHWNLDANPHNGFYGCWACKAGGRLERLLEQITGKTYRFPHVAREVEEKPAVTAPLEFASLKIAQVPSAQHYLARRGIDLHTAEMYGLALCVEAGQLLENRLVIPARDYWTGALVGWVGRSYTGARPKYLSTIPPKGVGVTGWRQQGRTAPVVIVEGHIDGIQVHRAGYNAAVLSGMGQEILTFASRLDPATPLVLMLDGDAKT